VHCHSVLTLTTLKFGTPAAPAEGVTLLQKSWLPGHNRGAAYLISGGGSGYEAALPGSPIDGPIPREKFLISLPFRRPPIAVALIVALAGFAPPAVDPLRDSLLTMRLLDQRVAGIGHRLAVASRDWCRERQWLAGFAIHNLSQYSADYREPAIRAFGLDARPAILATVEGGPADRAGLRADDALLTIDGEALAPAANGSFEETERMLDAIDRAFADGEAVVGVSRAGTVLSVRVEAEEGCATRFHLIPDDDLNARADGRYVQVTTAIAGYVADDAELAAVLAHEFAHNVLGHRARLDAAGVARGFFGNFGRSARLTRETEVEADRLSVYLVDRAGFDPEAAVRFWSRFGRRGVNFLGSATHPNWRRRLDLFRVEIDAIRRARAAGAVPVPSFTALPPTGSVGG